MTHIYIGRIPGIFGYGIVVASTSIIGAMDGMRKAYDDWKRVLPDDSTTFESSYEYYGGHISKVILEQSYTEELSPR